MSRQPIGLHGVTHLSTGSDPIPFPTPPPYMVYGSVYNDAGIIRGTGFTVEWDNHGGAPFSLNYYTIYFDTPFNDPPIVPGLAANNNNPADIRGRYIVSLVTVTTGYIVITTVDADDPDSLTAQDGGFDFLAMEEAPAL